MKYSTYETAKNLQTRIAELEIVRSNIKSGELVQVEGYNPEVGGTFRLGEDLTKKINDSIMAILNLELRKLKNKFLEL